MYKLALMMRLALAAILLGGLLPGSGARAADPALVLQPSSGACGSPVLVRGSGWPAGLALIVQRGSDNGPVLGSVIAGQDGTFALSVVPCTAEDGESAGAQVPLVAGPDKAAGGRPPLVRGSATFTVGAATCHTFPETGKTVCGPFLAYWMAHGGLMQQGYPISDELTDRSDTDGKTYRMQYFERAVFESHPANAPPYDVLLSLLGAELYNITYPGGAAGQHPNTAPGSQYFARTGHRVGGAFLSYWQQHGGLAQQGYPLSDEFQERSPLDGKFYTVQYFERAVFEQHPENRAPYDVLLSQLGTLRYHDKYGPQPGGYPGKIVFDTVLPDGPATISIMNPDGSGRVEIAAGRSPLFGPDGTRIAFLAPLRAAGGPGGPVGTVAIRATNLDGSQPRDLCTVDGNAQLDLVRWSPRNRYIALNGGQNPPGALFMCDLGTGTLSTPVTTGTGPAAEVFDWTAGETARLWQAATPAGDWRLYYGNVDVAEGALQVTHGENRADTYGLLHYPAARLSPDGKTIAIAGARLYFKSVPGQVSPLDGKTIAGLAQPARVAWSPDSRALAVVDGATHVLFVVDVTSGRITKLAASVGAADWSPR